MEGTYLATIPVVERKSTCRHGLLKYRIDNTCVYIDVVIACYVFASGIASHSK